MKIKKVHSWHCTYKEAVAIQKDLNKKIKVNKPLKRPIRRIAGADISYSRQSNLLFAAVVVLNYETMEVVEKSTFIEAATFPYIPGLLSFREGPALIECFRKLKTTPDAVIFDGQGIAHPRGIGIASHIGLFTGVPSIGCGKTRLCGAHDPVGLRKGDVAPLIFKDEICGIVLRTKDNVKPLYISPGHNIDFDSSVRVILECCRAHRLPEPVRKTHMTVNEMRKSAS